MYRDYQCNVYVIYTFYITMIQFVKILARDWRQCGTRKSRVKSTKFNQFPIWVRNMK